MSVSSPANNDARDCLITTQRFKQVEQKNWVEPSCPSVFFFQSEQHSASHTHNTYTNTTQAAGTFSILQRPSMATTPLLQTSSPFPRLSKPAASHSFAATLHLCATSHAAARAFAPSVAALTIFEPPLPLCWGWLQGKKTGALPVSFYSDPPGLLQGCVGHMKKEMEIRTGIL